jgi:hypothetical protein
VSRALSYNAAVLAMALAMPAFAEPLVLTGKDKDRLVKAVVADSVVNGVNDAQLKGTGNGIPDLQLLVSEKENTGSIAVSFNSGGGYNENQDAMNSSAFVLRAYGKLNDGKGNIIGLDGFSGNAGAELSWIHYSTGLNKSAIDSEIAEQVGLKQAYSNCKIQNAALIDALNAAAATNDADKTKAAETDLAKACGKLQKDGFITGAPGGYSAFQEKYAPDFYAALVRKSFKKTKFVGFSAAASQQNFDYVDRAAFKADTASRLGLAGSAFGGLIGKNLNWSLTGSFRYERKDKAADDVTLCKALAANGLTQCLTGADGLPVRSETAVFGVEWRQRIVHGLAIAPRASYDANSKDYSLTLPVFFAGDENGGLRGGVRGTFVSRDMGASGRKDSFALSLFIGVPFSVFTQ